MFYGLQIDIKDIIDILLAAFIMFEVYRLLRRSGAVNLFCGIFAFVFAWILVSFVFRLSLTGALFDRIIGVGAIALLIIFQEEIRAFIYRLGARFSKLQFLAPSEQNKMNDKSLQDIVNACKHMCEKRTGALLVLAGSTELKEYVDTGERVDALVSSALIENIFFKNSPLHDGAIIIQNNRIEAAACILPISRRTDLPKQFGLRHRAALGMAEKTDALIIVVSEETGRLCLAHDSDIKEIDDAELIRIINSSFNK